MIDDFDAAADGDLLDRVVTIREELADLNEAKKSLDAELVMIEGQLLRRMDQRKTDKISNAKMTASKTTSIEAKVVDWDSVFEFIKASGDFALLQKRISVTAFRELLTMGQVPGIIPDERTSIGFRKR